MHVAKKCKVGEPQRGLEVTACHTLGQAVNLGMDACNCFLLLLILDGLYLHTYKTIVYMELAHPPALLQNISQW